MKHSFFAKVSFDFVWPSLPIVWLSLLWFDFIWPSLPVFFGIAAGCRKLLSAGVEQESAAVVGDYKQVCTAYPCSHCPSEGRCVHDRWISYCGVGDGMSSDHGICMCFV